MNYTAKLRKADGSDWVEIAVPMGRTILETALAEGLDYPHGCRSGNCGGCKSHLIEGEVEMSPYSAFALSEEEKSQGMILCCRAVPWSDCTVQPIDAEDVAVHASRRLTCRVRSIEAATHDIRIVTLDIEAGGPFDYTAGQYARVTFDGLPPRDFSMASRPAGDQITFHIRHVEGGQVTGHVLNALAPGDPVMVAGPIGTAHYRARHTGPILLAAGGSGLAPILAILEAALADGARQDIRLYFGVRTEADIYMEDRLRALAAAHPSLRLDPVLSEPDGPTARRTGFLADALATDISDPDGWKAYLAGPPVMVETCTAVLIKKGMAPRDIHADAFYTEPEKTGR